MTSLSVRMSCALVVQSFQICRRQTAVSIARCRGLQLVDVHEGVFEQLGREGARCRDLQRVEVHEGVLNSLGAGAALRPGL